MKKRFLLFPDTIYSRRDHDRHTISFTKLIKLYGLNPAECLNVDDPSQTLGRDLKPLIWLGPIYNGDYREHLKKKLIEHDNTEEQK